jgi:uncharacterized protein (DUF58 family)
VFTDRRAAVALRLEPDFLKKLEYLHVVSKRTFAGQHRADRKSEKRGRGLEFADHRQYSHGDDFRHIDWNAYKRLNRLLLRLFDEERDLPIYLLLDVSRSMAEPAKFDQARRIAAALCYIGLAHLDHVTILPFGDGIETAIHPGRGKGFITQVLDRLDGLDASGATNLYESFKQFAARGWTAGLCVVISDCLDPAGCERALKLLASAGHEIDVVHLTSKRDRQCAAMGELRLVDEETGDLYDIEVTPGVSAAYEQTFDQFAVDVERFCGRYGMGYLHAETERPFEEIVLRAFRQGRFLA